MEADGECGPVTLETPKTAISALEDEKPAGKTVLISGGNCYIRTSPNTSGKILGVAHNGDRLPYGGETSDGGWPMVEHNGQNAWVSSKYGRLIDEYLTPLHGTSNCGLECHFFHWIAARVKSAQLFCNG